MFLARATQQHEETTRKNTVKQLELKYMDVQEEQDYGMNEEVNFKTWREEHEDQPDQDQEDFM